MLQIKDASVSYDRPILKKVSLDFDYGKVYGIIGKSGAGKTTLLKVLSGLIDIVEGGVYFNGSKLIGPSLKLIPGYDDIQLVNQDFGLDPYHTVEQNIKEKVLSRHEEDQEALIEEFLELVELKSLRNQKAHLLSGGEQQRLSIARALACEPKILLLDEPFVHLDQTLRWKVMQFIKNLHNDHEMIVVLVSHDGSEMMGFVDEVVYLENAEVKAAGGIDQMYYYPYSKKAGELLGELNEIELKGERVLFRPNEYEVAESGIKLSFKDVFDTGLLYYNFFETTNGERVMLSSLDPLKEVGYIKIRKKHAKGK